MGAWKERPRHSDEASAELLGHLLLEPAELFEALAPNGWERSPLRNVFHPTPEQLREERERVARNLASWLGGAAAGEGGEGRSPRGDPGRSAGAAPGNVLDDEPFVEGGPEAGAREDPASVAEEPEREVVELLGRTLWDVFSDNHTVVDSRGVGDEAHEDAMRRAREEPLPATVAAYRDIFGVLLEGWPHPDM